MYLGLNISCAAQPSSITPQVSRDLKSSDWHVRRNAFEHLAAVHDAIHQPQIQQAVVGLLEIENDAVNDPEVDLYEDDDYIAYDEQLTRMAQGIAETTNDSRVWKALVYKRYNADSVFGQWISAHRQTLPFLLEQLKSPYWPRRMYSIYCVAAMLAHSKKNGNPFTPATYLDLKQRVREFAAHDDSIAVQESAMRGLGLIGDKEDAVFLHHLSKIDSDEDEKKFARDAEKAILNANPQ